MKKSFLLFGVLVLATYAHAQLEAAKILGKRGKDYGLGYGLFVKIGVPVNEQNDITLAFAPKFFFQKESDHQEGIGLMPVLAGYRHVFGEAGSGIYVEPQLGYNFYNDVSQAGDGPFKGLVWGIGTGYLSPNLGGVRLNPGINFESVSGTGGTLSYVSFRFAVNFSLGGNRQ